MELLKRKNIYLTFYLGNELFAVEVTKVIEVLELQKITKVPKSKDYVKGVINFRGEILPVIETRIKFNLPPVQYTENTVIIVFDVTSKDKRYTIGAIADAVSDVFEFSEMEIADVPDMGSRYNVEYLKGMINLNNNFIMLLNIDKLFDIIEFTSENENE